MAEFDYETIDRRCFEEVWTHCDLDAVASIYHPDLSCHHPPGSQQGRSVTITGLSLYHYEDGLIRAEWTYWDQLGLRQQLTRA